MIRSTLLTELDRVKAGSPLRHRGFRRYLGSFGASLLGDQLWFVGLAWAAARSGSPDQASFVMAAGSVPRAVLLLVGGAWADRRGARRMALLGQGGRLLAMVVAVVVLAYLGRVEVVVLAALAFLFGLADAVYLPAMAALPPLLLEDGQVPAGQGMVQTLERVALVAAGPLGGLLVAIHGMRGGPLALVGAVNGVLFLAAGLLLWRLGPAPGGTTKGSSTEESVLSSVGSGLRYIAGEPVVLAVLVAITLLNLGMAGPLNVGLALLAEEFGWSPTLYGWMLTAFSSGAVLGALGSSVIGAVRRPAVAGLVWVIGAGASLGLVAATTSAVVVALVLVAVGVCTGPAAALLIGLIQTRVPHDHIGRVMSAVNLSSLGLTPVAYLGFGRLAAVFSVAGAFAVCGAAVVVTAVGALGVPTVRRAAIGGTGDRRGRLPSP